MKKEDAVKIIEEVYSMPHSCEKDIKNIEEKIIKIGQEVDEQNIETVFRFICVNAFAQSLN